MESTSLRFPRPLGTQFPRTKPLIAAVDGHCLAGGMEIALNCDLLCCSPKSSFGLPEVKRALVPAAGGLVPCAETLEAAVARKGKIQGDSMRDRNRKIPREEPAASRA